MNPKPPLPNNEIARLHALRQYQILDTPPEKVFDEFTFLAAQICRTPIALISLVDGNRQWFKSKVGIREPETHRDLAFCAYSILQQRPLIVRNALLDPRFAKNPLVTSEPDIRFYAGAPLITPEGFGIGTLCVIDSVPRDLTPEQVEALRLLSHQIVAQFELRRNAITLSRTLFERQQAAGELRHQQEFIEAFYQQGEEKASRGDYQGAIAEFNQFLRLNPKAFKAYYSRGLARQKLGDSQGAMADLDIYLRFAPHNSEARYYRGLIRLELGDYQGAIADYSYAIQMNPDFAGAGNFEFVNSEFEGKQQLNLNYTQSLELNADNFEDDINLIPNKAFPQLEDCSITIQDPTNSVWLNHYDTEVHISPSHSHYELENYTQAFPKGKRQGRTGLNSDLAKVHINRGNARSDLEDYSGAIEDYTESLQINPNETEAYISRGNARSKLKDYSGAIEDYKRVWSKPIAQRSSLPSADS